VSQALRSAQEVALDKGGAVFQVGPALNVQGGVSSVERLIVEHIGDAVSLRHIATTEDGSLWRKLCVFVRAILSLRHALRCEGRLLVHIHFASRGSTLRKMILAEMTLHAGRPLVLHAHGAQFNQFFSALPAIVQRLLRRMFARADCFVVLSTQWRDFYVNEVGVPAHRVAILHNPVSLPPSIPARVKRERVQFLFLGRIGQRKGAFDLLRAFAALPARVRERARLVFAGDGDVERLTMLARECGENVEVHSWVTGERLRDLFAASDVFVLPSYQEGVPMALLEAMAFGLPVITTRVGGIPDVVTDQREGYLLGPGDVYALQAAMAALIEDEQARLALGARARARAEQFDVADFTAELTRIYSRLLR
jgi:glycosyltransferase involved in cell wall biosynthesis